MDFRVRVRACSQIASVVKYVFYVFLSKKEKNMSFMSLCLKKTRKRKHVSYVFMSKKARKRNYVFSVFMSKKARKRNYVSYVFMSKKSKKEKLCLLCLYH